MFVCALTGGIGSGKSSVADAFEARAIPVARADVLARLAVEPQSPGLQKIVERFGDEVLDKHGALDRKALGALAFKDPKARADLESIIHPEVRRRFLQFVDAHRANGTSLVVYEIPLLFESKSEHEFDCIIAVVASESTRRRRIAARDQLSDDEISRRIASQTTDSEKIRRSHFVLYNEGDLAQLQAEAESLLNALHRRAHWFYSLSNPMPDATTRGG